MPTKLRACSRCLEFVEDLAARSTQISKVSFSFRVFASLPFLRNVYSWFRESLDAVPDVRCNGENEDDANWPAKSTWLLSDKLLRPEAQEDECICTNLADSSNKSWHPGMHLVTKPIQLDAVCFKVRIAQWRACPCTGRLRSARGQRSCRCGAPDQTRGVGSGPGQNSMPTTPHGTTPNRDPAVVDLAIARPQPEAAGCRSCLSLDLSNSKISSSQTKLSHK